MCERPDAIPEAAVEAFREGIWNYAEHKLAASVVREGLRHAAPFLRAAHPETGSEETERELRLAAETLHNIHRGSVGVTLADCSRENCRRRAAVLARAAHLEAGSEDHEAGIEAATRVAFGTPTQNEQRQLIGEAIAAYLRAAHLEAGSEEADRLRDAARAFVRETGVAHPAIARIPADAPAAVRYDETRAALLALLDAHPEADRRTRATSSIHWAALPVQGQIRPVRGCDQCGRDVRVGMHCPEDTCPYPRTCVGSVYETCSAPQAPEDER